MPVCFRYLVMGSKWVANHVLLKSKYVCCVWVDMKCALEYRISWSFHSICMFMHSCLCAMCFHACCCICTVCLHVFEFYLWQQKKEREALRPTVSWSNWHVNHVSVGGRSVRMCVCERSMTYLQRQRVTAGVLSSSPSRSDAPHSEKRFRSAVQR